MSKTTCNTGNRRQKQNRREQPRKDSKAKRVNYDNTRIDKFEKDDPKNKKWLSKDKKPNDISWYARNPELMKSAASIPFAPVLGSTLGPWSVATVPGILKFEFNFQIGVGDSVTGQYQYPLAINQAGKSMYSFLVHANSRNYSYEYQDLTMTVLAGGQVFAALAHLARAYGIAKFYQETSFYTPDAYLLAMGFDPSDFRNNLGKIWFDINNLITQTQQIWIPNTMPIIDRWVWLCSNLFYDAEAATAQTYMFVPDHFWQFSETGDSNGTSLEWATYPTAYDPSTGLPTTWSFFRSSGETGYHTEANPHKWDVWKALIQHMIDRLVNSEDRGIMMGDILNAYGADKIRAMAPIPSDFMIAPVYNQEVLTQIENLTINPVSVAAVCQDTGGIYPKFSTFEKVPKTQSSQFGVATPLDPIINFHQKEQPTPEQIVVATRLSVAGCQCIKSNKTYRPVVPTSESAKSYEQEPTSTESFVGMFRTCGSETVSCAYYIVRDVRNVGLMAWKFVPAARSLAVTSNPWLLNTILDDGDQALLSAFDWHPFVYAIYRASSVGEGSDIEKTYCAVGDFDKYSTISCENMKRLHDMALMSEFGVPQM